MGRMNLKRNKTYRSLKNIKQKPYRSLRNLYWQKKPSKTKIKQPKTKQKTTS